MSSFLSKNSPERVKSAKFTAATIKTDDSKQHKIESTSTSKASVRSSNQHANNDENNNESPNKKTPKTRNSSKGSASRSPDYHQSSSKPLSNTSLNKSGDYTKKPSSKSPRRKQKSSKSPRRKHTGGGKRSGGGRNDESSLNFSTSEQPKSTAEYEDMSSQGLTLINAKIFQSICF